MLISPSPATLERHTDALLLAATTDDAHDDAQLMCRAALEALNVLDLRLVGSTRRAAVLSASQDFASWRPSTLSSPPRRPLGGSGPTWPRRVRRSWRPRRKRRLRRRRSAAPACLAGYSASYLGARPPRSSGNRSGHITCETYRTQISPRIITTHEMRTDTRQAERIERKCHFFRRSFRVCVYSYE
jgi:hypothetical protein